MIQPPKTILAVPLTSWLGTRLGKKRALISILSLGIVGSHLSWFIITLAMPYLQIVSLFLTRRRSAAFGFRPRP